VVASDVAGEPGSAIALVAALLVGVVGAVVARWWVALLPPLVLAALVALWQSNDVYSRYDEFEVWVPLATGLALSTVSAVVGVLIGKANRRKA
jgi:hypothetical protein